MFRKLTPGLGSSLRQHGGELIFLLTILHRLSGVLAGPVPGVAMVIEAAFGSVPSPVGNRNQLLASS